MKDKIGDLQRLQHILKAIDEIEFYCLDADLIPFYSTL
jgi:hypothetical protein